MLLLVMTGKTQTNMVFYPIENQFNSSGYNPAFLTSNHKITFSIFPMGGTSIGYNNQRVIKDMVSNVITGNTSDDTYKQILISMLDRKLFHQSIESTLLTVTYHSSAGFFNFRIKENETFMASAKGELTSFILNDDIRSVVVDQIQNLPAQAVHYREYSLGYSFKSPLNRFYGGIRAKLYFGKAALYSTLSGSINKNEANNYILNTTGSVYMSFPQTKYNSATGAPILSTVGGSKTIDYLLNSGNVGVGVDLGFKYRFSPDLSISMSIIDLGKINWKTNLNSKYFKPYTIPDSIITDVKNDGVTETITKNDYSISEDLSSYLDTFAVQPTFSRSLPLTVYASVKYQVNPGLALSLTNRFISSEGLRYNSIMAAANFDITKKIALSTGYSIIGNSYFNIPAAILYKGDFGQIYFGSDNLASILLPSISEYAGISFGTCFYLFRKRNLYKKAPDYLPFHKPKKRANRQKDGLILKAFPES